MTSEELKQNLGTLAKSGTSEFLSKAEGNVDTTNTGNLIGAFGLGFYSSFLVADQVEVASIPPASEENPRPIQHVFTSNADESSFEIFPDPRGNTLGRGTEITLYLKDDSLEYLSVDELKRLVCVLASLDFERERLTPYIAASIPLSLRLSHLLQWPRPHRVHL